MNTHKIREGVKLILDGIGVQRNDPNFLETPDRVAGSFGEIFAGMDDDIEHQVNLILSKTFPCEHQQMIVARNVEVYSMCPHHLLPVHYEITVGYLPGTEGARVIGLSKLCRITKLLAARPILQEQMVNDITNTLMAIPGCDGAGCIAHGEHYCMRMRGVNQSGSVVVTSSLTGSFLKDGMVRSEFMALSRRR